MKCRLFLFLKEIKFISINERINLSRFIKAQSGLEKFGYSTALNEIKSGRKINHWMWYIFPQIAGLAKNPSYYSSKYVIQNKKEAVAYFNHPILGARLVEISQEILALNNQDIVSIVGKVDSKKLKSCMTLFDSVTDESVTLFKDVLNKYFSGLKDQKTLDILKQSQ